MIDVLTLKGLRGFVDTAEIEFAKPTGMPGSGLTFLVGGNNTGKTTVIEALQLFNSSYQDIYLSEGKRNAASGGSVELNLKEEFGGTCYLWTLSNSTSGGAQVSVSQNSKVIESESLRRDPESGEDFPSIYILQSHRFMNAEFYRNNSSRDDYLRNAAGIDIARQPTLQQFEARLFQMEKHKESIAPLIERAFGEKINWSIELRDNGTYYLKFTFGNTFHSLDGAGDGLWNVFTLCDSLYDAPKGSMVVLDEPEQSLHPQLQKRMMSILMEESKSKQIVISTHSPYFIDWNALSNQGALYRFRKDASGGCHVHRLGEKSIQWIGRIKRNLRNPHILGQDAKEIFFLDDGVIVCEGQDDVIMLEKIADQLNTRLNGELFGWGAGGSPNIDMVLTMLEDLGFEKVVAIFDGNVTGQAEQCRNNHPNYSIITLSTDDIRDKDPVNPKEAVSGMVSNKGVLKEEHKSEARKIIQDINSYLKS